MPAMHPYFAGWRGGLAGTPRTTLRDSLLRREFSQGCQGIALREISVLLLLEAEQL